jgi:hypothetical protein
MGLAAEARRYGETRGEARRVPLLLRSRGAYGPLVGQGGAAEHRVERGGGRGRRERRFAPRAGSWVILFCAGLFRSRVIVPTWAQTGRKMTEVPFRLIGPDLQALVLGSK